MILVDSSYGQAHVYKKISGKDTLYVVDPITTPQNGITYIKLDSFSKPPWDVKKYIISKLSDNSKRAAIGERIRILVKSDGHIQNILLTKSNRDENLNRELVNIIQNMPAWKPAYKNNKPVDSYFFVDL